MTREQQKKLKELRTALPKILQMEIKPYGFKKRDYMAWVKKGDMFFTFFPSIREQDGRCFLDIKMEFKPLWLDDLFWDIMDMTENKKEPLSLRSTGAFTVNGAMLYCEENELARWSIEEVTQCTKDSLARFNEKIQSVKETDFENLINEPLYHAEVRNLLMLIHKQYYDDAIEYAEGMEHDWFINGTLGLREAAVLYCREVI